MAKQTDSRAGELSGQAVAGAFIGVTAALAIKTPGEVGLIVGAALPLVWDLRKHPWKFCPRCGESKRNRAGKTYGMRRECWRCRGQPYPRVWSRPLIAFGWRPRGHPDRS